MVTVKVPVRVLPAQQVRGLHQARLQRLGAVQGTRTVWRRAISSATVLAVRVYLSLLTPSLTYRFLAATANTVAASGGARRLRRDDSCKESSHTKCPIPGLEHSFECIDTRSNIESCGGCANAGGVDCTAIKGIGAVTCSAGSCNISCVHSLFFLLDVADSLCLLST